MAEAWKVKAIREAEGLTLAEFSIITGIRLDTLVKIELNGPGYLSYSALLQISRNPRFTKYTLWLMTGRTQPEHGQIAPVTSNGQHCAGHC